MKYSIPSIIQGLENSKGDEFLRRITFELSKVIKADYTFIARLNVENYSCRTLSLVAGDSIADNFEYSLNDTPCANVADDSVCIYSDDVTKRFPLDQLLIDMNIAGYVGTPLKDHAGRVFGLMVALYKDEIDNADEIVALFNIFSGRIAVEIERNEQELLLNEYNENLERMVEERTFELQKALSDLKHTQTELIEQEKMASLGRLVAGVAHEINTPLGVAILSNSVISENVKRAQKELITETLTLDSLNANLADLINAAGMVETNLKRATKLIENFKLIAVDKSIDDVVDFNLHTVLSSLLQSLTHLFKQQNIQVQLQGDEQLVAVNYVSDFVQVMTNLIANATHHAFVDKQQPAKLEISFSDCDPYYEVCVRDNGKGISAELQPQIFEPFFTTNRSAGNTGLGLSIVYSMVVEKLGGNIHVESKEGEGSCFYVRLAKQR